MATAAILTWILLFNFVVSEDVTLNTQPLVLNTKTLRRRANEYETVYSPGNIWENHFDPTQPGYPRRQLFRKLTNVYNYMLYANNHGDNLQWPKWAVGEANLGKVERKLPIGALSCFEENIAQFEKISGDKIKDKEHENDVNQWSRNNLDIFERCLYLLRDESLIMPDDADQKPKREESEDQKAIRYDQLAQGRWIRDKEIRFDHGALSLWERYNDDVLCSLTWPQGTPKFWWTLQFALRYYYPDDEEIMKLTERTIFRKSDLDTFEIVQKIKALEPKLRERLTIIDGLLMWYTLTSCRYTEASDLKALFRMNPLKDRIRVKPEKNESWRSKGYPDFVSKCFDKYVNNPLYRLVHTIRNIRKEDRWGHRRYGFVRCILDKEVISDKNLEAELEFITANNIMPVFKENGKLSQVYLEHPQDPDKVRKLLKDLWKKQRTANINKDQSDSSGSEASFIMRGLDSVIPGAGDQARIIANSQIKKKAEGKQDEEMKNDNSDVELEIGQVNPNDEENANFRGRPRSYYKKAGERVVKPDNQI